MKKKILILLLACTFFVGCSSEKETPKQTPKQTVKNEEKNTKSNPALDELDPIQKGDIKNEKDSVAKSKKEMYKDLEDTYSPDADYNKGKDKSELKALKNYDKVVLDGTYKAIDQIIETCENENRYFRKSEMETLKIHADELLHLKDKWDKITKSK